MSTLTPFDEPVLVSRPWLPPLEEYHRGLEEVWASGWLTNGGPVLERFRHNLAETLGTPDLALFANGTLALEAGFDALGVHGEVITTPFTFPATVNVLARLGLRPVFVDVEPERLTLDPAKVEAAITADTAAILAVHVYGQPARVEELQDIATRNGLPLIYDAAHAFGVRVGGLPIAMFGDMSMFSLHATKPVHSVEGGIVVCRDPALVARLERFANHGLDELGNVATPGTNAKMSELHALMGDLMLSHMEERRAHRRDIEMAYRERLGSLPGLRFLEKADPTVEVSFAFMPVLIDAAEFGMTADDLQTRLLAWNVHTRRYFHPLVCDHVAYLGMRRDSPLEIARAAAEQVLTLPIHSALQLGDVERICTMVAASRA